MFINVTNVTEYCIFISGFKYRNSASSIGNICREVASISRDLK